MPYVTKTKRNKENPLTVIGEALGSVSQGVKTTLDLQNQQEQIQQRRQIIQAQQERLAMERDAVQDQRETAALGGIHRVAAQFRRTQNKKLFRDTYAPVVEKFGSILGVKDPQKFFNSLETGSEEMLQGYDDLGQVYQFLSSNQAYSASDKEFDTYVEKAQNALNTIKSESIFPENQALARAAEEKLQKTLGSLRDKRAATQAELTKVQLKERGETTRKAMDVMESQADREAERPEALVKYEIKDFEKTQTAAKQIPQQIETYDTALDLLDNVETGPITGSGLAKFFRKRGVFGSDAAGKLELLEATLNTVGLNRIVAFLAEAGARAGDSERESNFIKDTVPQTTKDQETNKTLLYIAKGVDLQKKAIADAQKDYLKKNKNLNDFDPSAIFEGKEKYYHPNTHEVIIVKPGQEPKGFEPLASRYGAAKASSQGKQKQPQNKPKANFDSDVNNALDGIFQKLPQG